MCLEKAWGVFFIFYPSIAGPRPLEGNSGSGLSCGNPTRFDQIQIFFFVGFDICTMVCWSNKAEWERWPITLLPISCS